jgi:hypothetical protein
MAAGWVATLAVLALVACGGGGGGSGAGAAPATVGVTLTDAPTTGVDEALATITSVELIGASGRVTLFSGSETIDLLELGDFSELFAVSDAVPPGTYSKIRLRLSDLVLNRLDPATGAVIETIRPQLVGNGKIDLNPQGPFEVASGDVLFVEIDFDMEKSLKITTTGSGAVIVRPVVFVDIRPDRPGDRLTRIHGRITDVRPDAGTLRLCQTEFASRWDDGQLPRGFDDDHCVTVRTDADTGVFDVDGLPQSFVDLVADERATVIGRISPLGAGDEDFGANHHFVLDAVVIEEGPLGTYRRVAGTAASGVDAASARFDLDVAPAQGLGTDTTLAVQLFEQSRIFSRNGTELDRDAVLAGRRALADGVLQLGAQDLLRSPLVILDDGPPGGEAVLEGAVVFVDESEESLIVNDGSADRCVSAATAEVFLVGDDDGLSATRGDLGDLRPGQAVSVFGVEGLDGCLVAGTILADD